MLARIRGKGIVVITGCGHPTIKTILAMAKKLTDEPVYAVVGGFICRYAIDRLDRDVHADVVCLEAGQTYRVNNST